MFTLVSIIHVIMSLILIVIVLLQTSKGSDIASAFGGGGSHTMFGSQGATSFLNKLTTVAAIMFMVTSLTLAILSAKPEGDSLINDIVGTDTTKEQKATTTEQQSDEKSKVDTEQKSSTSTTQSTESTQTQSDAQNTSDSQGSTETSAPVSTDEGTAKPTDNHE